MKRRRHTPERIIRKLREADRLLAEGRQVPEVVIRLDEFGPLNLRPHPATTTPATAASAKSSTGQTLPNAAPVSHQRQVGARVVLAGRAPDVP